MDFITDQSGRHLLRMHDMVNIPEYVKQAGIVDREEVSALSVLCFADPVHKEFPINTAAHTFLSYGYCKSANVQQPLILGRIKKAGAKLGITKDLDSLDQIFGQVKQATSAPEKHYAIVLDFGSGNEKSASAQGVQSFYPINNSDEIQSSAINLDNHKNQLPLDLYVDGCREIVKAANTANMEDRLLPARVRLYGTEHIPNFDHVTWEASRREQMTGDSVYSDLAKAAALNAENKETDDYIRLWALADASNGLVKYSNSVPDPWRIFNVGASKRAYDAALDQHVVLGGAVVPVEAFTQVTEEEVKKTFPKEASESVLNLIKAAKVVNQSGYADVLTAVNGMGIATQKALLRLLVTE